MTSSFGFLSSFDHNDQDWSSYKSRLLQWFIANDIGENNDKSNIKRRAILLSALSEGTHKLASDLALPKPLEQTEFVEILSLLDNHFTPKRFGFAEKSTFYMAHQQAGETHTQWAARLRGLAAHCNFKNLEEALLDKFIMGMLAGPERDKLFVQTQDDLSFSKAVDMAESIRCARQAAAAAQAGSGNQRPTSSEAVFAINNQRDKPVKCSVCGYTNHNANQCRFKNYNCKKCHRKGHLRKMCSFASRVNYVEESAVDDGDDGMAVCISNIRCLKGKPMSEWVGVGGLSLEFEVDSGSAVSVISQNTYMKYFSNVPLSITNKKLIGFNGGKIIINGLINLPVTYNNMVNKIDFFIVQNEGPSLLGRDFIRLFQLELAPVIKSISLQDKIGDKVKGDLVGKFSKLFSGKLGAFNKFSVKLRLKPGSMPIFFKARPVPYSLKDKINLELDRLIELGILKPVEHSEYASPIVPVLRKDGGIRICADYSVTINKQLIIDKYPLPTVNDLFSKLHGGVQFSKIDMSRAYNQFLLNDKDESQNMTCINTHRGLFVFTRLVFGLSSAPAIFQRAIENLLAGLEGVITFLDDICVTGTDYEQHKQRLTEVLSRLENAGLAINESKCEFFQNEISYLGHIIDRKGIRKCNKKVSAILNAQKPNNLLQLQSFLGLTNYYRDFVPDASTVLSPLYELLTKNSKWEWNADHDESFKKIKMLLASDKTLAHYDQNATLILTVDASPCGLGAVLSQMCEDGLERPVSYASRTLTKTEKRYGQIQKEATAIIFGVRRYHQYLYGRSIPFILRTDHKPLITIFGPHKGIPEITANRLQRYAIFLSAYNYQIEYVRSDKNSADFLSRAPEGGDSSREQASEDACEGDSASYVNFIIEGSLPVTITQIKLETERDPVCSKIKEYLLKGWPRKLIDLKLKPYYACRLQLSLENGCLMRGHKVVIPESLRNIICKELHSSHFGIIKMKAEARRRLWFPGVDSELEKLARDCTVCAALRPSPPHTPLASWPHPPQPFYRVHADFLGPFNDQVFLIIVDAFSKWVECYLMSSSYGSKAVIEKFYDFISRVGIPHTLVTDNGTSFKSSQFKQFCDLNGIRHVFAPAYHPSSNGQAESFVKIVKKGLKNILLETGTRKPDQNKILKFLFDYRNSRHSATEKSPAELVFGHQLRSRLDLLSPSQSSASSTELTNTVQYHQSLQAKYYRGRTRSELKPNDKVLIKRFCNNKKFTWINGWVVRKIGNMVYTVFVPELNSEVTRHIDQIWKKDGLQSPPPCAVNTWDVDVFDDIQPSTSSNEDRRQPSADVAARTPPETPRGSEAQAASAEPCAQLVTEGDSTLVEAGPSTTATRQARRRRLTMSPIFSTPTQVDDEDDSVLSFLYDVDN